MAEIIWEGASLLSPKDSIRVYLTGRDKWSENRKTGPVLQTYIMLRDIEPTEAVKSGADSAICGDCKHIGPLRTCYVNVGQAPNSIHRSRSSRLTTISLDLLGAERIVRLGAYGDPAAVPFEVWDLLLKSATGWLGYTHQWKTGDQRLKQFCMASVDNAAELDQAHDLGWRCFYVGRTLADKPSRSLLCPASAEAGKKMQCAECLACAGLGARHQLADVFIPVHGPTFIVKRYLEKSP